MDTNTLNHVSRTTTGRHPSTMWAIALAGTLAMSASAVAQTRPAGRRVTPDEPDQPFRTIWVVDRAMPDLALWRTMVHLTSSAGFQPVVVHGGDDERWTASLNHLLRVVPEGQVIWVSDRGTPIGLDVDASLGTIDVAVSYSASGPVVYSADESLDPIAALIAMRLDGRFTVKLPEPSDIAILVGVEPRDRFDGTKVYLSDRTAAMDYANQLAERPVVMVVPRKELAPEYILWAFQRDTKILEVDVSSTFSIYDAEGEADEVEAVREQIHSGLPQLVDGGVPEALVIAGDWHQIPFRFPRRNPNPCVGCDNSLFEYSADVEYANLDRDPWGEPEVPVGRLMSPFSDLLAIQTVVGIWREFGAFRVASDGVFLGLLGTRAGHRREMVDSFQTAFSEQLWTSIGPEGIDFNYRLDREAFFDLAARSDLIFVHGHGHPDFLSPRGHASNTAVTGEELVEREDLDHPAFWFLHACATGKPEKEHGIVDRTLLVGLQSRLAYGALMAVEDLAAASGDPVWWTGVVEPDLSIGELVRRFHTASIGAYRDRGEAPQGIAQPTGDPEKDRLNAMSVLSWFGDPLTPVGLLR